MFEKRVIPLSGSSCIMYMVNRIASRSPSECIAGGVEPPVTPYPANICSVNEHVGGKPLRGHLTTVTITGGKKRVFSLVDLRFGQEFSMHLPLRRYV